VKFQLLVAQVPESFEDILRETIEIKLIMTPQFQENGDTANYAVGKVPGITVFLTTLPLSHASLNRPQLAAHIMYSLPFLSG
jgi:hypothetical protein